MSLSPQRRQQWQGILDLTQQMRALAATDDWQKIAPMAVARQDRLAAFFAVPAGAGEAAEIADGIRQILDSDRALAELGSKARQAILGSVKELAFGRKALAAYEHCRR